MTRLKVWPRGLLAVLMVGTTATLAEGLTVGTGVDYSSGDYGEPEKTEVWYVPVTGKYETGLWTFRLAVPFIRITGPGNVIGAGEGQVTIPGAGTAVRTESGLGDIVGGAFYNLIDERDSTFGLDVGAKVKLGTGDNDKGLGTGENDYSVQVDVFKPIGVIDAFGSLGYRLYGDPPGLDLHNVFYGSVGGSYRVSSETSVGLAYDFRPSITSTGSRISEVTAFMSQRLSRELKLQAYGLAGFSDGSPDFGIGVMFNYSY
ncbi:MAG TPA: transporter [Burkholderiales bacterium]|nr:transporter [Burkholderiales bacterium]